MDRGVVLDTIDTVVCVQVLVESDLEDRSTTLTANDGAVGKEEDPYSVPLLSVSLDHVLLIADPVLVPSVDSSGVVDTEDINVLNLKASPFKLVDDPTERAGSIRTREDILIHEKAPDEILILP